MKREMIGNCELTCENCMELMARYPDKHFDLAIIDPPYGIGESMADFNSRNNNTGPHRIWKNPKPSRYIQKQWDSNKPDKTFFNELFRIATNSIIFGANHFISLIPFDSPCWIVWNKKTGDNDFADCELAWTSFNTAVRMFEWLWKGFAKEKPEERIHPTQKPVALYKWLLSKYAKPGWKILDTHLGSGSHAIACYDMGFSLTACEIDEDYFDAAIERLRLFASQGTLNFGENND